MHADLYLRPAVQNFGLLQYAALSEIQRLGYIHATEAHRPDAACACGRRLLTNPAPDNI